MTDKCNVDDILCQLEVLRTLKELQEGLSKDWFKEKFPELEEVNTKLSESITEQNESIRQAVERCAEPEKELITDTGKDGSWFASGFGEE